MKKLLPMITAVLLFWTIAASAAEIPVFIDGTRLDFDVQPLMIKERPMVPMRFIFEKLGATVSYDEETSTISAFRTDASGESVIILIQIDNPKAFVNSSTIELDSPPMEIDGRTLVPLPFVGEALGCKVDWDEQEEAVYISTSNDSQATIQKQ